MSNRRAKHTERGEDVDLREAFHERPDAREAQRLARGRNIVMMRQATAAGIVTGGIALMATLHQNFAAQASGSASTDTSRIMMVEPVAAHPAQALNAPLPPSALVVEDPVLIQGRARAAAQQQVAASTQAPVPQPIQHVQPQVNTRPLPHQNQSAVAAAPQSQTAVFEDFIDHLLLREGFENQVYRDTRGILTVGVGHRVLKEDNLREGQTISNERVRQFLYKDAQKAFDAAIEQAAELGIRNNPNFVIALASVNFQLGTGWNQEHRRTWSLMTQGRFRDAANEAANSAWNRQTPVRVRDFQDALRDLEPASAIKPPAKARKLSATFEASADPADEPQGPYKLRAVDIARYETNGASTLVLAA